MSREPKEPIVIEVPHGRVEIVTAAKRLDPELWSRTFAGDCLDARYYEVMEETLRDQFDFRYAVLSNGESRLVQPFFLTEESIVSGLPVGLRSLILRAVGPRLLRFRLLFIGCAAGEGQLGSRMPWALNALAEALVVYARQEHAALIVFKDFPADDRNVLAGLRDYHRLASMPSTRLDLGFASMTEYFQTRMSRGIRSNLRRKLRDSERSGEMTMEVVNDVSGFAGAIHDLYLQTYSRSSYRFERLTPQYFSRLGQRLPDRTRFFLWRSQGRLLAFTLCMVHGEVLHYLNLGMDYAEAPRRNLYFRVWCDLVKWAIDHRMAMMTAGQLNYEAKARLGLDLIPLDLYLRATSPWLNGLVRWIFPWLGPVRYHPVLRKFRNFGDL